jgi:dynein heavy chain
MFKNVIIGCFNKMSTIQQGVQLLEAFDYLAKRETIKAEVKKQALLVLRKFDEELDQIKNEYDNMNKNNTQISLTHGKYSG